jgi:hypothetical protein
MVYKIFTPCLERIYLFRFLFLQGTEDNYWCTRHYTSNGAAFIERWCRGFRFYYKTPTRQHFIHSFIDRVVIVIIYYLLTDTFYFDSICQATYAVQLVSCCLPIHTRKSITYCLLPDSGDCKKNADGSSTFLRKCVLKTNEGTFECECKCVCSCGSDCKKCTCPCECSSETAEKIETAEGTKYRCECQCNC